VADIRPESTADFARYDFGEQAGYTKAMRRGIAALHEPRAAEA
jgi:hypothetical protein